MQRIALATFLLLAVASPRDSATSCAADPPQRIRILTYNIHHGEGVDGKLDLERIATLIKRSEADLVALQEVDQNVQRTGAVDQPAELARLTGMKVIFGGNLRLQGGEYGNAILSRWPIKKSHNYLPPSLNSGEPRGVLVAEIAWPGSQETISLLATHLDHRRDEAERIASAKVVNEIATQPFALFAGDLNAVPQSKTLAILQATWSPTNDQPLPTIPVDKPVRQIDFVLYKPHADWQVVETRVLDECVASDHRPLLAVLEYQTP